MLARDGALVSRAHGLQDSVPGPHPGVRLRWQRRGSLLWRGHCRGLLLHLRAHAGGGPAGGWREVVLWLPRRNPTTLLIEQWLNYAGLSKWCCTLYRFICQQLAIEGPLCPRQGARCCCRELLPRGMKEVMTFACWPFTQASYWHLSVLIGFLFNFHLLATHWKRLDAGKDWRQEEKGATEGEMVGWHHRLNGHELEQTLWDSEGLGSLMRCSPRGFEESDRTEWGSNYIVCKQQPFSFNTWETISHSV